MIKVFNMETIEEWRKCDRNENYSVSNKGRVKNDRTNHILKGHPNHKGYLMVTIGKGNTVAIHRLVAEAFIPKMFKIFYIEQVDHISKNVHSHSARHTVAILMLNRGIPIEMVSKFLGHTNISITSRVYAKVVDDSVIKAFKKAEVI